MTQGSSKIANGIADTIFANCSERGEFRSKVRTDKCSAE